MMGHKNVTTTQVYARKKEEVIRSQLEYAENIINGEDITYMEFNKILSQKYLSLMDIEN